MNRAEPRKAWLLVFWLSCLTCTAPAHAEAARLSWHANWRRVSGLEYGLTGTAAAATLLLYFAVPDASEPRWLGGVVGDAPVRNAFRLRAPEARDLARSASDLTALSMVAWAVAVDSLTVPLARRSTDVAAQLSALDAEALSISSLISTAIFKAAARGRPSFADCQRDPSFDPLCGRRSNESFPSGHASVAFTAAGLSCAHHLHLALYANRDADVLACVGMLTLAAATGTLRVLGDRHHASDVWFGALLGFAVGYGMPTLFHYGRVQTDSQAAATQPLGAGFVPTISGIF